MNFQTRNITSVHLTDVPPPPPPKPNYAEIHILHNSSNGKRRVSNFWLGDFSETHQHIHVKLPTGRFTLSFSDLHIDHHGT